MDRATKRKHQPIVGANGQRLKYLQREKNRAGQTRYRIEVPGQRKVRVPGDPTTLELEANYWRIRAELEAREPIPDFLLPQQRHPLYGLWRNMNRRCSNPKAKDYAAYGGRGISVCERWAKGENGKDALSCFIEDVSPRPSMAHSIDRIDNNGNYEPGNWRWATSKQQCRNSRRITVGPDRAAQAKAGFQMGLSSAEIARDLGLNRNTVVSIKSGLSWAEIEPANNYEPEKWRAPVSDKRQ